MHERKHAGFYNTCHPSCILINTYNVGIIGSQNIEAQPMKSVRLAIHVIGYSFSPKYKIHIIQTQATSE